MKVFKSYEDMRAIKFALHYEINPLHTYEDEHYNSQKITHLARIDEAIRLCHYFGAIVFIDDDEDYNDDIGYIDNLVALWKSLHWNESYIAKEFEEELKEYERW